MKTELTIEQSRHLCELGLAFPYKIAIHNGANVKTILGDEIPDPKGWYIRINITDLLEILPKEIYPAWLLRMDINNDKSCVYYKDGVSPKCTKVFYSTELIDALYELVVWCIENGHLKFD